jgi:hypothetical protein
MPFHRAGIKALSPAIQTRKGSVYAVALVANVSALKPSFAVAYGLRFLPNVYDSL